MAIDLQLVRRAGHAGHDLVGWLMWDPAAIARFEALGVPSGVGWLVAWRVASLGPVTPEVAAAATYSIEPGVIETVMGLYRGVTDETAILAARNASVVPGLADVAPGLVDDILMFADDLWRGVDSVHGGARPMFAAARDADRPDDPALSVWLAANCLRELRGDNHWVLCAADDLDGVEVGLLHSVMLNDAEYGSTEWIPRSRGFDDTAIAAGWSRLADKGLAENGRVNAAGVAFRHDLEKRTDRLTAAAWDAVGQGRTQLMCDIVGRYYPLFLARINATAGQRWMPAMRSTDRI